MEKIETIEGGGGPKNFEPPTRDEIFRSFRYEFLVTLFLKYLWMSHSIKAGTLETDYFCSAPRYKNYRCYLADH